MRSLLNWLRDFSGEYSPSERLAIDVNDMMEDLLAKYPHDHVIAALFSAMRARCETPATFREVSQCAEAAFGRARVELAS